MAVEEHASSAVSAAMGRASRPMRADTLSTRLRHRSRPEERNTRMLASDYWRAVSRAL